MFQDRTRINEESFIFLCETLGPSIKKFHTPMIASVDVETIVVVTFARLETRNTLSMIDNLYGSTASIIVQECCNVINTPLFAHSFGFLLLF